MKRLSKAKAVKAGQEFYFDEDAATRPERFFTTFLSHTNGVFAGKPFEPLEWQKEMFREMFGWLRVEDDARRYRTAYISTAKKNGKTSTLAGLALYLTIAEEYGNQTFFVASDVNQAGIAFREAMNMVKQNKELSRICKINKSTKNIACTMNSSFARVLPGDGRRVEGVNGSILFDELHSQVDRRLYDSVRWAGSAKKSPWFIATTTAGYDRESICYEMYQYALQVQKDWTYDPSFYSYICEMKDEADWRNPKEWPKANPSWGVTIKPEDFKIAVREAENSIAKENSLKRYRLNCWTSAETMFFDMDKFNECGISPKEPLEGKPCWVGLDLATTYDTSAMVAVFPRQEEDESKTYDVIAKFWIPKANAEKRELRDHVPYLLWEKEKANGLTFTDGDVCDYGKIRADINEFAETYKIQSIFIDRWNANQLSVELSDDGFNVQGFSQGIASMSAPTKLLENLVASNKIRHGGNKILINHAMNTSVRTDPAGNIRPVKPSKNSAKKIDGIVALVMGLAGASTMAVEEKVAPQILVF